MIAASPFPLPRASSNIPQIGVMEHPVAEAIAGEVGQDEPVAVDLAPAVLIAHSPVSPVSIQ